MCKNRWLLIVAFLLTVFCLWFPASSVAELRIGIMQDKKGMAETYRPLLDYLRKNGLEASFVSAESYPHAAKMFAGGQLDAMFSGSGVAGCMIIKGLASASVRPLLNEGWSTYWAVVLAPKGSPRFTQNADYFTGKRVIFCGLASSGEFFFRSITDGNKTSAVAYKASSHGAAIDAISRGFADVAIVKNRVWDKMKADYENIIRVGEDPGENPNMPLMISKKTDSRIAQKAIAILIGLNEDNSEEAKKVKEHMKISGFMKTTTDDFKFTIPLLRKAGEDETFNFTFDHSDNKHK